MSVFAEVRDGELKRIFEIDAQFILFRVGGHADQRHSGVEFLYVVERVGNDDAVHAERLEIHDRLKFLLRIKRHDQRGVITAFSEKERDLADHIAVDTGHERTCDDADPFGLFLGEHQRDRIRTVAQVMGDCKDFFAFFNGDFVVMAVQDRGNGRAGNAGQSGNILGCD